MGVSDPSFVDQVDVQAACLNPADHSRPMCADAIATGLIRN